MEDNKDSSIFFGPKLYSLLTKDDSPSDSVFANIPQLEEALLKIAKEDPERECDVPAIERVGLRKFLVLMEFIESGIGLRYIDPKEASFYLSAEESSGHDCLKTIGMCIGFDLLINNWDRLPIAGIWNNEGNLRNLLLKKVGEKVDICLIDQTITVIVDETKRQEYVDKVKDLVQQIFTNTSEKSVESLSTVQEAILLNTAFDIGPKGLKAIEEGMKEGLSMLVKLNMDKVISEAINKEAHILRSPDDLETIKTNLNEMLEKEISFMKEVFNNVKETVKQFNK